MTETTQMHAPAVMLDADPYPQIVEGRELRGGQVRRLLDPSTGEVVGSWCEATDDEVDAAVAAARKSFDGGEWRRMPPPRRAEVLQAVADAIRADAERLATLEAIDTGKPITGALAYDLYEAATAFAFAAGVGRDLHGDVRRAAYPPTLFPNGGPEVLTLRVREPVGVVAELLPWNGPLMTGSQRLAAALAAGCSVVAKAPEEAVVGVVELARLLARCGVPTGVVNVLLGRGERVGERLVTSAGVDLVSLTGSVATGQRVMELASRRLTAVNLELGGKSPVVVFADADLKQAVQWATMAAFVNMGEVCVAGSRLLVEASVYDEVVSGIAEAVAGLRVGPALDPDTFVGPLVSVEHARRVRGYVERALAAGDAQIAGQSSLPPGLPATFVPPVVLTGVHPGCEIEQDEIFGPVLVVLPFRDEGEALAIANDTRYGLNATVFTRDLERAFRIAEGFVCGEVNVNCHFAPDMNGGRGEPRRMSGLSRAGIDAYTTLRAINVRVRP